MSRLVPEPGAVAGVLQALLNTRFIRWLSILLLLACVQNVSATPADDLLNSLRPTADVNDFAGLLSPAEKESLEARCRQLRERTGAQLAVVTLKSLEGGNVEDFTNKLFERWGVGEKGKNNGLMLLVAMGDRRSRIEVGYGLEPIIPDMLAGRILDHDLRPHFRDGNYAAGLTAAVNKICELVEQGEPADRQVLAAESEMSFGAMLLQVVVLSLFVAVGGFVFGQGLGAKQVAGLIFGVIFGGIPLLMGVTTIGPLSLAVHVPVALAMGYLGWKMAKGDHPAGKQRLRRKRAEPIAWSWGDSSGGSYGGWTAGGGGFSQSWGGFGGGSSGGGGASGSW